LGLSWQSVLPLLLNPTSGFSFFLFVFGWLICHYVAFVCALYSCMTVDLMFILIRSVKKDANVWEMKIWKTDLRMCLGNQCMINFSHPNTINLMTKVNFLLVSFLSNSSMQKWLLWFALQMVFNGVHWFHCHMLSYPLEVYVAALLCS
jgi:hypothetical protein